MELYHLHLLGNYDKNYKEGKVLTVNPDKFNNRLYKRIYDMNPSVDCSEYPSTVTKLNSLCATHGLPQFDEKINLGEVLGFMNGRYVCAPSEVEKAKAKAIELLLAQGINLRELAMEEYRKNNCPEVYSRLHSIFACDESALDFWITQIRDNDLEIFRIDAEDEPFHSNANLLPNEGLPYGLKVEASRSYFHPKAKEIGNVFDEYLVQGKVLIKEKVGEVKFKR